MRGSGCTGRASGRRLCGPVALILFLFASGCHHTALTESLPLAGDKEMAYWHGLAEHPIVSNDEAMHGLVLLVNKTDPSGGYEQRVSWLKEKGLLSKGFKGEANDAVERGTVAQVVANYLHIKGGVTMHLIGAHPRYATRELVYRGIMPPSTSQQALPGIEFMGIISKAETYTQEGT